MTTLTEACGMAWIILDGFRDSSLYDDYKSYDGWTDGDFNLMMELLLNASEGSTGGGPAARPPAPDTLVVVHGETGLFWHDGTGWGPLDGCRTFDAIDRTHGGLPPGGEWLPLAAAGPAPPDHPTT